MSKHAPKAEIIYHTCPHCGRVFSFEVQKKHKSRTLICPHCNRIVQWKKERRRIPVLLILLLLLLAGTTLFLVRLVGPDIVAFFQSATASAADTNTDSGTVSSITEISDTDGNLIEQLQEPEDKPDPLTKIFGTVPGRVITYDDSIETFNDTNASASDDATTDEATTDSTGDDTTVVNSVADFDESLYPIYQALSVEDQKVYELFLDLAAHRTEENYFSVIQFPVGTYSEDIQNQINAVYQAVCREHPELFWLQIDPTRISGMLYPNADVKTNSDSYTFLQYTMTAAPEGEDEQIAAFEAAVDEFMAGTDLTRDAYSVELELHDRLIDLVSYDYDLLAQYDIDPNYDDLGETAYGVFIGDSLGNEHQATCIGYSLALEYVLQKAGITSCIVTGIATSESEDGLPEGGNHAWNMVSLNDAWYEVDSCWDDFEPSTDEMDESVIAALVASTGPYAYTRHHFFNRTTAEMADLPADDATIFYLSGYQPYNPLSYTTHVRLLETDEEGREIEVRINRLLPTADGTEFRFLL